MYRLSLPFGVTHRFKKLFIHGLESSQLDHTRLRSQTYFCFRKNLRDTASLRGLDYWSFNKLQSRRQFRSSFHPQLHVFGSVTQVLREHKFDPVGFDLVRHSSEHVRVRHVEELVLALREG